jgi:hypothetical protein
LGGQVLTPADSAPLGVGEGSFDADHEEHSRAAPQSLSSVT